MSLYNIFAQYSKNTSFHISSFYATMYSNVPDEIKHFQNSRTLSSIPFYDRYNWLRDKTNFNIIKELNEQI